MYLVINPDTSRVFETSKGSNRVFESVQDAQDWCDEEGEVDCLIVEFKCFS